MGNNRFRLSDIMPNAWFYKLKDMSKTTSRNQTSKTKRATSHHSTRTVATHPPTPKPQPYTPNRPSYYFSSRGEGVDDKHSTSPLDLPLDPPRKSKTRARRKLAAELKDMNPTASELNLPPILTKPSNDLETKQVYKSATLKSSSPTGFHRLRMRANSPRIAVSGRRSFSSSQKQAQKQKQGWLLQSFAVVKRSSDPGKDFRDSMAEMIVANNIRSSKGLEDLLACYLSLNSDEYHDVIVKVFQQIWFDLTDTTL